MTKVVTTRDYFEKQTNHAELDEQIKLRLRAGAKQCEIIEEHDKLVLETEWRVDAG